MAVPIGVWGIDLGQCALKALRVELQDGQVVATAFDYVEYPKILSQPDADPDQLTREALDKFLSRNTLRGDTVAISVPGQSGLARFVKLPPVEEKKIADIVKFEAKQQIPFNLDEVVWDFQKISAGMVTDGFALDTEIGLFAMKRELVYRYLQHFRDVNVEVHVVQMAPLCLCNYVSYDLLGQEPEQDTEATEVSGKKASIVALDIGADSSNLVVTDGQRIIWQRPIPLGGNHFTRALTKELKLTFAKAEHLKRNATKSGPELKKILSALKPVLNDFVGEVQRSLGYFTNTHRDAHVEYMIGLGSAFRLPGLQRFLAEKLQLDVRKLQKLERLGGESVISAPAFAENVLSFAVAYGLALQGLRAARLQTNLLPPEIQQERLIRAKKPWAVAAAAALLAGTFLGPYLGYALDYRAVDTEKEPLKGAIAQSKAISEEAVRLKGLYEAKKSATEEEEKAVRSIIAGLDERLNWIRLTQFLNEALPRPDGSNLTPAARHKFFDARGQAAFARYQRRLATVRSSAQAELSDADPDLIQFNIEAIEPRYVDDLKVVWERLAAGTTPQVDKLRVRPSAQFDVPPTGAGWIVELRGFTHHQFHRIFVLEGLVEALASAGIKSPPAAPPGARPAAPAPGPSAPADDTVATSNASKDPVIDRISHVVLLKTSSPEAGGADLIRSSVVAQLAGGGATAGGSSMTAGGNPVGMLPADPHAGGGMSGATGASRGRSGWKPLLGASSGQGGSPLGAMGSAPGVAPPAVVPGIPGAGPAPGYPGSRPSDGSKPATPQAGRTDFIVLFFWKENTPSDQYLPTPSADTTSQPPMPGPMPAGPVGPAAPEAPMP
jgi:type IV pilus assembly protein PilM